MSNAIERLAAEMTKLSDDEWMNLVERRLAGKGSAIVFGPAWDEISERLAHRELTPEAASDQAHE